MDPIDCNVNLIITSWRTGYRLREEICESNIQVLVVSLLWEWLTYIEWRECHEYICLEERDQQFEEPEWECEDTECSSMERRDEPSDIDHHRDEDRSDEYVQKETHREWTDTDELSSKV